ncbi:MAG: nucleotidyltransferase domain-containing protein [Thermodesulfovibrio sp.]|nr:nucleotidyltransferase domain-containing protein [Thermodesulfovibrio sp.]
MFNLAGVYLYGSAVRSMLREDSDIDIAILPAPDVSRDEILILISQVEDLVFGALFNLGIKKMLAL